MKINALIDKLITVKDGLPNRTDRDIINDACSELAKFQNVINKLNSCKNCIGCELENDDSGKCSGFVISPERLERR